MLEVYQKAYYKNISYIAWQQGQYNYIAHSIALSNSFAKKSQQIEYPKWQDPYEKIEVKKPIITQDNLEYEFRKQQADLQNWLFHK